MAQVSIAEIVDVRALVDRLTQSPPLGWRQAEVMRDARSFDWAEEDTGPNVLAAHYQRYRALAFDVVPKHGEFYGKAADQDLGWNVLFLGRLLDDWFSNAHSVPPHWAQRICVLLRKAKQFELEREFLSAFIPHYVTPFTSPENSALIDRAIKVGAYPTSSSKTL